MAATTLTIWSNLVAAVEGINGAGAYTHALGADKVVRDRISSPPVTPFATVVLDEVRGSHDDVLGTYRRDVVFTVVGWGLTTADTVEARQAAAVNMLDDLMRAAEADRSLSNTVYDVLCTGRSFVASESETGAVHPVAVVRVECWHRADTGV
jgi:hypothetical protein